MNADNQIKYYSVIYKPLCTKYLVSSLKELQKGSFVKCETPFGNDVCFVQNECKTLVKEKDTIKCYTLASYDIDKYKEEGKKEKEIYKSVEEGIKKAKLELKIIDVHIVNNSTKVVVLYTAEQRVDFRELVKGLNEQLRPYFVQMHQLSSREVAKLYPSVGVCGCPICCSLHSSDNHFPIVTRKMMKDQNIKQDEFKMMGCCGNLKCCFSYEEEFYENELLFYPNIKAAVSCKDGTEWVKEVNVIKGTITLENEDHGRREVSASLLSQEKSDKGTSWVLHEEESEDDLDL